MFKCSLFDPLRKDPILVREIERDRALDIFDKFPWIEMTNKMRGLKSEEIEWAPSIEFENKQNQHGLNISILDDGIEFYIFYKRPKLVNKFFGLLKKMDKDFSSITTGQTINDARGAVIALVNDDFKTLELRWG